MTAFADDHPARPDRARLEWPHLPPTSGRSVEDGCGSPVVDAESQGAGFTPGFASVLTCADGLAHFVKAACCKAQRMFAEAYREEARKLAALPERAGAAAAVAHAPTTGWCSDRVRRGRQPERARGGPPTSTPLPRRCWQTAAELHSRAAGWRCALRERVRRLAALLGRCGPADLPGLAATSTRRPRSPRVRRGRRRRHVVHTDVRDDNLCSRPTAGCCCATGTGRSSAPPWLDTVFLMIGPRGDGSTSTPLLAAARSPRDVPASRRHRDRAGDGYFLRRPRSRCRRPRRTSATSSAGRARCAGLAVRAPRLA